MGERDDILDGCLVVAAAAAVPVVAVAQVKDVAKHFNNLHYDDSIVRRQEHATVPIM